jgi:uncharacterized protein YbjT (DUF2867 family)
MAEPVRICLVGATGLTGWEMIEQARGRSDVHLVAVARREVRLPPGARMEMVVADPADWGEAIAFARAQVLVCALGTTWRKARRDEAAFRAVDHDLVLDCARAAKAHGIEHVIFVSSVGANSGSGNFYLRVKGEVEQALARMHFRRLDVLRPGLLRGRRRADRRLGERLGIVLAPLIDPFLTGRRRKYRSIRIAHLAGAIFALARQKAAGRFVHEYDALRYALRRCGG